MSKMSKEILSSMSGLKIGEDHLSANFCFKKNFVGFQGHFDQNPVLPGICKIQAILVMYKKRTGKELRLDEVISAKYTARVTCNESILIETFSKYDQTKKINVLAKISKGETKVAVLKLLSIDLG